MSDVNLLEQEPEIAADSAEADVLGKPEGLPDKFWDTETKNIRLDDLIKSYCALEKKLGAGFTAPEDEEGRRKIMIALGMPETPDAYDVKSKSDLITVDADVNKRLHAKGFTSDQVQEVYDLASERLVPMILDIAAEFQADREVERLVAAFGGKEQWSEISRQLLAYGRKNLSPKVLDGLSGSYDGVMALYQMMKGETPAALENTAAATGISEKDLHGMMRDPKYWRDKDPATIAKVTDGFKQLYG
ncbi:MAG TPA: hypothetical protein VIN59_00275 [Alphaproteobacteria bacterium]